MKRRSSGKLASIAAWSFGASSGVQHRITRRGVTTRYAGPYDCTHSAYHQFAPSSGARGGGCRTHFVPSEPRVTPISASSRRSRIDARTSSRAATTAASKPTRTAEDARRRRRRANRRSRPSPRRPRAPNIVSAEGTLDVADARITAKQIVVAAIANHARGSLQPQGQRATVQAACSSRGASTQASCGPNFDSQRAGLKRFGRLWWFAWK